MEREEEGGRLLILIGRNGHELRLGKLKGTVMFLLEIESGRISIQRLLRSFTTDYMNARLIFVHGIKNKLEINLLEEYPKTYVSNSVDIVIRQFSFLERNNLGGQLSSYKQEIRAFRST